jgi:hypothetical protein
MSKKDTKQRKDLKRFMKWERKAQKLSLLELGDEFRRRLIDAHQVRNPDPSDGITKGNGFVLSRSCTRKGLAHFLALDQFVAPLYLEMEKWENERDSQ